MAKVLILSHQEILKLNLSLKNIILNIKEGFKKHSLGKTYLKPKISLVPKEGSFYTAMPGGVKDEVLGLKLIERFENKNYPSVFGTMFLNDEKTGKLLSIMDATWLTSIRTGAIATISIEIFANPEVNEISIIGLGNTAIATLKCIEEYLPHIKKVNLFSYKDTHLKFIEKFKESRFEFEIIDNLETFIKRGKIIISAITYASKPFIKKEWLNDDVLILPIHSRGWQECDEIFDKIYTDDYEHTKHFIKKLTGELGDVLLGKIKGKEKEKKEKIIAYNIGIAIDDIVVAKLIYDEAKKQKVGLEIELDNYNSKVIF